MERRNFIKLPALLPGLKLFKRTAPKSTTALPIAESDILIADTVPTGNILMQFFDVGMGTSTPAYPLHVYDSDEEVARLWIESGQLKFAGDTDTAAQRLFEVLRGVIDEYVAEKLAGVS